MSIDCGVYFRGDRTPSHARWQGAIYGAGFQVALMPVDLLNWQGHLPVMAGSNEYDSGFEFSIKPLLASLDRLESLLRGVTFLPTRDEPFLLDMDRLASFHCNAREWPAAVCAAVGFAKASGGVFRDGSGCFIPDIEAAIAYARRHCQDSA